MSKEKELASMLALVCSEIVREVERKMKLLAFVKASGVLELDEQEPDIPDLDEGEEETDEDEPEILKLVRKLKTEAAESARKPAKKRKSGK